MRIDKHSAKVNGLVFQKSVFDKDFISGKCPPILGTGFFESRRRLYSVGVAYLCSTSLHSLLFPNSKDLLFVL